jgi:hypothetical protein
MPTNTPIAGFRIPVGGDDPDVVDDLSQLARGVEKRVISVFATPAARDTAVAGLLEEGLFAFTKDFNKLWYYDGAAWVEFVPSTGQKIGSGPTVPTNADPTYANGDVFFKV